MSVVESSVDEELRLKMAINYIDTWDLADQNLTSYAVPRKYGENTIQSVKNIHSPGNVHTKTTIGLPWMNHSITCDAMPLFKAS
ncbi:hypothetical protein TNCV_406951 [Trichonephila clavipes]|nr:hypothetical protein TNCV_406951 [Trichonephila clavipes]